jgi:uncharacterized coiled-coil DUF342 family protein
MSEERLERIEQELGGLKTDVAGLKTDVGGLKGEVGGLREDMTKLQGGLKEFREQMLVLHEDTIDKIKALAPDFDPLRREFREADAKLADALDKRIVPLEVHVRLQSQGGGEDR